MINLNRNYISIDDICVPISESLRGAYFDEGLYTEGLNIKIDSDDLDDDLDHDDLIDDLM
ncbi:MAG: hypothetical protein RLY43_562 [Bacteroidota bacterium]|jgi:hypothetical protein